jgi:hypothetical protein
MITDFNKNPKKRSKMRVKKFRVHVFLKGGGLIKPVIETNCRSQAQRIVEAQYPGASIGVIEELS